MDGFAFCGNLTKKSKKIYSSSRTMAGESQEMYPRPYVHRDGQQAPAGGDACVGVAKYTYGPLLALVGYLLN
jgi:hypothetical protein